MSTQHELLPKTAPSIDPRAHIGHVSLTVADLDGQIEFYEKVIGLQVRERSEKSASLA